MVKYFNFRRKQRRMAFTLVFNAVLAYVMYIAASHYLPILDQEAAAQILAIADVVIWAIEVILIGLAVYFWRENKSIELWVSPTHLHYFDPTFTDYGWTVPVKDILEIEQFTDTRQQFKKTLVVLASGERKQLNYGNFSIDRQAFFNALKKANTNIILPNSPYRYKIGKTEINEVIK